MKTNYGFLYVIMLLAFLITSCADEAEEPAAEELEEVIDEGSGNEGSDVMYFPPVGSNEWKTVSATEIGWDTTNLNEAIRYAKEKRSNNLLVIHKGKIVVEEYWRETNANSQRELNSIAKSMMGFVIGMLQEEGTLSINDKVSDYLGAGWSASPNTESEITILHLLTMTSGLNERLEYAGRPGEIWRYSHTAYKMLYDVIKSATGGSARDLFDKILFAKIGMTNYSWQGYDVSSSAREIAKFGLMMLNEGVWNGEKLIHDEGYFSDMVSTSQPLQQAYGYLWWLNGTDTWYDDDTKTTHEGSIASTMPSDSWLAKGFHDQRIYVVPSLDLVVIRQGEFTSLPESGEGSFDEEFWKRLMNAIENSPGT